jgi:hypothetical protein
MNLSFVSGFVERCQLFRSNPKAATGAKPINPDVTKKRQGNIFKEWE